MAHTNELNNILEILGTLSYTHFASKVLVHLIWEQLVISLPALFKSDTRSFRKFWNYFFSCRRLIFKKMMFYFMKFDYHVNEGVLKSGAP
jgi:hypothetical protein